MGQRFTKIGDTECWIPVSALACQSIYRDYTYKLEDCLCEYGFGISIVGDRVRLKLPELWQISTQPQNLGISWKTIEFFKWYTPIKIVIYCHVWKKDSLGFHVWKNRDDLSVPLMTQKKDYGTMEK